MENHKDIQCDNDIKEHFVYKYWYFHFCVFQFFKQQKKIKVITIEQ